VRIVGTDIVETADVKVIVPPDAVKLPEVFAERTQLLDGYAFSLVDSLPFVPSVLGNGACTDLLTHESFDKSITLPPYSVRIIKEL